MKKILCIITPSYWEQKSGGAELQCYLIAKHAKILGWEVHYIYVNNGAIVDNELDIFLHPMKKIPMKKRFGSYWFFYFKNILHLLNTIKPKTIYVRGGWSFSAVSAFYSLKKQIVSVWGVASDNDFSRLNIANYLKRPFDFIEHKLIDYSIHRSTFIVCQNEWQRHILKKKYNRDCFKIAQMNYLCIDNLYRDRKYVVWIANIKKIKRPDLFINLVEKLNDLNVEFLMLGRPSVGKIQENIDKESKRLKNFKYLGELTQDQVNEYLLESLMLVNTSDYEGFSNTFVQAWMRRVPVISLNSDPDGILSRLGYGYCLGSFDVMVSLVYEMLYNKSKRDYIADKFLSYAKENHSIEKNILKLMHLFDW